MKTSFQWWQEVKESNEKFTEWLKAQYHGEVTAAKRIKQTILSRATSDLDRTVIKKIISDEVRHALWLRDILLSYGVEPKILSKTERYWDIVNSEIVEYEYQDFCAIAAHAETMRLERIKVIVADVETPDEIRRIFTMILVDEMFHADAFESLAGRLSMEKTADKHELGMKALGLVI